MPGKSNGFTKRMVLEDKSVEAYKEFIIGMMRSLGFDQPERTKMTEEEWKKRAEEFWNGSPDKDPEGSSSAAGKVEPAPKPKPKPARRTAAKKAAPKKPARKKKA